MMDASYYRHNKGGELNPWKRQLTACHSTLYQKERSMNTLLHIAASDKIYLPRPGAPVRYATYSSFEGYASVTEDWTVLFRTSGSLWYPVLDQADLVILGLVGDAETQLVLDTLAGGYAAIATSRANLEV